MTTKVSIAVPLGEMRGIEVRAAAPDGGPWGTGTATIVGPGQVVTLHVWAGQALHIQERDGGGGV